MSFEFCVPCLFGLEGIAADELRRMNMKNVRAENGRVLFSGEKNDIPRANINLATGERVLILAGSFEAKTFDQLFEGVRAIAWENYIPKNGQFPVKGHSLNSALHSVPDCQKIIKKAMAARLGAKYKLSWLPENGAKFQIQFSIMKDLVSVFIDTSGAGLHKRGYRPVGNAAPLRETLAAAMVRISRYRGRGPFCDPFCGSGTIAIEAALAARNRAPGLYRSFDAQAWPWLDKGLWKEAKDDAISKEYHGDYDILGSDIDPKCIEIARENAKRAGVSPSVRFETADARSFDPGVSGGTLICNPPYGERLMDIRSAQALSHDFGLAARALDNWKIYVISSDPDFERHFGKTAEKKRKLYNGMIKCDLYMYLPKDR